MTDENQQRQADRVEEQRVETGARNTIADLLGGKVGTSTINDLGKALDVAKRDRSLGGAIGRKL